MNTKALVITDGQSTRVNELCFWDTDVGWGVGGDKGRPQPAFIPG